MPRALAGRILGAKRLGQVIQSQERLGKSHEIILVNAFAERLAVTWLEPLASDSY